MGNEVSKTSRRGFIGGAMAWTAALVWPFGKAKAGNKDGLRDFPLAVDGITERVNISHMYYDAVGQWHSRLVPHVYVTIDGQDAKAIARRADEWRKWCERWNFGYTLTYTWKPTKHIA